MNMKPRSETEVAAWRRRSFDVQASDVVAGRVRGPEPPRPWARRLSEFVDASRQLVEGPSWWTPVDAYFGSIETRTDPSSYYWDGMKRIGRRDHPLVFFQFTLAGFGHFEFQGRPALRVPPGTGFFAVIPSRHRYYLPESSPGWTFAWIGIYHPYLLRRIKKQVESTGPIIEALPASPIVTRLLRLVRGAFRKDYADRFDVERELFDFTLTFERMMQKGNSPDGQALLEELRSRVLADPARRFELEELARERELSPTAFSHFFRARTGLTPARFMTEVRVQEAARLLLSTSWSMDRIARECGFANGNHFGKVFRKLRHQSAGAYRRSIG
ncbi:MAG: helix-turn-helix domain-containing protein [Polyangiaceae bacterium]